MILWLCVLTISQMWFLQNYMHELWYLMLLYFLLFPHRWDYAAGDQAVTGCRHNRTTSQAVCASFWWEIDMSVSSLGWDNKPYCLHYSIAIGGAFELWPFLVWMWVRFLRRRLIDVNAHKSHPLMSVLSYNSQPSHFLRCSLVLTVIENRLLLSHFPMMHIIVVYETRVQN